MRPSCENIAWERDRAVDEHATRAQSGREEFLPKGTVTFLFTDIEGSTRLAQQYADEMPALLARHHAILNQAITAHNGFTFQMVGDSFAAAFHDATAALNAALDSQRALHQEAWSPAPIKVRMGIHTGAAQLQPAGTSPRYTGYATIALSQRIMSVGHGGQILLSQTSADLIRDRLPGNAELRDMGERRLKDVLEPERLYQLTVPDLPSEFPPLNTLDTFRHNLPTQLTSFIGREDELNALAELLRDHRMVTLTGSGGCGKTRLSIQVAGEAQANFPNGVWFVELAPIADSGLVPQTIVATLSLREDSLRTSLQVLCDYLQERTILLVLDNCEHVIESCAQLSESLLRACPRLKILASSREALGIAGETPYRVPSLQTPNPAQLPPLEKLQALDSIRLFLERAAIAKSDFTLTRDNASAIAQICFRLDGIPLAIELAAARVKVLSPEQIAVRLDDRFRLLTGGSRTALPRQQTLRAMIDWSYSLLPEQEKILFRRLAVFVGGWTLDAAEQVCGEDGGWEILDLLTRLVDKSLVIPKEAAGETRYRRLETIRQYSREKFFETDEVEGIRNRHLAFYVQFAAEAERQMQGRGELMWGQRIEAELDNLRAAMEWALETNPQAALEIASHIDQFWVRRGNSLEVARWLEQGLAKTKAITPEQQSLRARALTAAAWVTMASGDNLKATQAAQEAVALLRANGSQSGLADALMIYALPLALVGEYERAVITLQESLELARLEKNAYLTATVLGFLAMAVGQFKGDIEAGQQYADESIRIAEIAGIQSVAARGYEMKGRMAAKNREYEQARPLFEKAARAFEELGLVFEVLIDKSLLAHLERELGSHQRAMELYRETIEAYRDAGQIGAVAHQLECIGFISLAQNEYGRTAQLFAAAEALREKYSVPMTPDEQFYFDEQQKLVREKMDGSEFKKAWDTGGALTMDRAIAYALKTDVFESRMP